MNVILLSAAGQLFGIDADRVGQVVPPPPVTPLPFMPYHVEGLVNVGGAVMASIALARVLGGRDDPPGGVSVVVSERQGRFALRCERVLKMIPVDDADLHPLAGKGDVSDDARHGLVAAEFRWQDRMVLMIDTEAMDLGGDEVAAVTAATDFLMAGSITGPAEEGTPGPAVNRLPSLLVRVGAERYAMNVGMVLEVVEAEGFLPVPNAPAVVEGYLSLRGQPLLVASLGRLMGMPSASVRQVVVIDTGTRVLGLGVDQVLGIRILDRAEDVGDATGMVSGCVIDPDGTMLAVLELANVLAGETIVALDEYLPHIGRQVAAEAAAASEKRRLLTFWLGGELCGIDLDRVSRVAESGTLTGLPHERAGALSAITQVGNEVMPVIDLREAMGVASPGLARAQVVATVGGAACALAVDRMHRILDIPLDDIRAVDDQKGVVDGIGRVDGRLVSLLAVDALIGEVAPC